MYVGTSLLLMAVGAILAFAVSTDVQGFDMDVAGIILMVLGGLGLLVSLLIRADWVESRREVED